MRLRLVDVVLTPHFVTDDGENLTPIQVNPIVIPAARWPDVLAIMAEGVEGLRAQVETDVRDVR